MSVYDPVCSISWQGKAISDGGDIYDLLNSSEPFPEIAEYSKNILSNRKTASTYLWSIRDRITKLKDYDLHFILFPEFQAYIFKVKSRNLNCMDARDHFQMISSEPVPDWLSLYFKDEHNSSRERLVKRFGKICEKHPPVLDPWIMFVYDLLQYIQTRTKRVRDDMRTSTNVKAHFESLIAKIEMEERTKELLEMKRTAILEEAERPVQIVATKHLIVTSCIKQRIAVLVQPIEGNYAVERAEKQVQPALENFIVERTVRRFSEQRRKLLTQKQSQIAMRKEWKLKHHVRTLLFRRKRIWRQRSRARKQKKLKRKWIVARLAREKSLFINLKYQDQKRTFHYGDNRELDAAGAAYSRFWFASFVDEVRTASFPYNPP